MTLKMPSQRNNTCILTSFFVTERTLRVFYVPSPEDTAVNKIDTNLALKQLSLKEAGTK